LSLKFFYDNVSFRIRSWRKVKELVLKVIAEEGKVPGDLNFILTDDTTIKEINLRFLKHNYFTDVISFDYGDQKLVAGEIYISIDTVKANAKNYKVSYESELLRVIVHGVLHLCGYNDSEEEERKNMRRLEDYWLVVFKGL
jgi:probable rRNA maturation factor